MWVREMFLKKDPSFFVSASPVYMVFYVVFYVLANIVVLYYIIARYSSLSGSHAEDISTEKTTKGCSSSLRMSPNTNLLLNDENVVTDKLQFISAWNISNEEPILSGDINSFPGIYQGVSKFFRNVWHILTSWTFEVFVKESALLITLIGEYSVILSSNHFL